MAGETPKNNETIKKESDVENLKIYDDLINSGILSTVASPEAPILREQYFEFLADAEKLAQDFDNHLNGLRQIIGLPAYVECKDRNEKFEDDPFIKKQDKIRGALRLIKNLRELDKIYKEEAQPTEELKKQYINTNLIMRNPRADSEISQDQDKFPKSYFEENEYKDFGNAINPYLFLKDIEMGYDSNSHYIAQLLHELSAQFKDDTDHWSRFDVQINDKGHLKYVAKKEEEERLKKMAKEEPHNAKYYESELRSMAPDTSKPTHELLPVSFQERADNLIKFYNSLEKEYLALYEANKKLSPKT